MASAVWRIRFLKRDIRALTVSIGPSVLQVSAGVIWGHGSVLLDHVTITDSVDPVGLTSGQLTVRDSQFLDNKGTIVINVTDADIARSRFMTNQGSPVASLGIHGHIVISDSVFSSNADLRAGTPKFGDCTLNVTRSSFAANVSRVRGALFIPVARPRSIPARSRTIRPLMVGPSMYRNCRLRLPFAAASSLETGHRIREVRLPLSRLRRYAEQSRCELLRSRTTRGEVVVPSIWPILLRIMSR